ncbi:hypothetical protein PRIPAC_97138 [Pristionchus pacificus]|uniref:Uncharacterized protein n=1 Tax=Pristionchus pacificus TaxID=54126 RepID=A0A2A6BCE1_PRIPA|nr:hypothetical protein PRIPAC_97138 [Pristionchus pacificus]|eukprot:PDM63538.1 hypothetical protein PRIPAC_53895 [Pristionchus pacificus]
MSTAKELHWADYAVVIFSLLLSVSTGVYHALKSHFFPSTTSSKKDDYLMGGRQMPSLPVALSLLTTFLSGILMLGVPAEIYLRGTQIWLNFIVGVISSIITCHVFLPVFYKMNSTCLHEYFVKRYDSLLIRRIFSVMFCFFTLSYMSIVIYAPSVALSEVLEVNKSLLIVIFGISTTLYTCIGGLKAVVWADSIQAVMMYAGVGSLLIKGLMHERVGGISNVMNVAVDSGRMSELLRFNPDIAQYNSFWINIFSGTITWLASFGVNQLAIQRYSSLPSLKQAQTIIYYTLIPFIILCSLVSSVGLVALTYYYNCDPMETAEIHDKDHIVILFARDILQPTPGLFGLYVSCIMAATLSTLSSGMNSMSAAVYEDFIKQKWDGRLSDSQVTLLSKVLVIGTGLLSTGLAFAAEPLGGILRVCISVMGAVSGPMVAIFVMALFFPRSGKFSTLVSFIVSNIAMIIICGFNYFEDPYRDLFLPTNTSTSGCAGLTNSTITLRVAPHYDAHFGDPETSYLARISAYSYAGLGFVLMIAIAIPLTFFEKADKKKRYLSFWARNENRPTFDHEMKYIIHDSSKTPLTPLLKPRSKPSIGK